MLVVFAVFDSTNITHFAWEMTLAIGFVFEVFVQFSLETEVVGHVLPIRLFQRTTLQQTYPKLGWRIRRQYFELNVSVSGNTGVWTIEFFQQNVPGIARVWTVAGAK